MGEFQRQVSSGFTDRFLRSVSCEADQCHDGDDSPSRDMDGRKMDPDAIFHACAVRGAADEASCVQDVMEVLLETGQEIRSCRKSTQRGSSRRTTGDDQRTTERASFKRVNGFKSSDSRMSKRGSAALDAGSHVVESDNAGASSMHDSGLSVLDEDLLAQDIATTKLRQSSRLPKCCQHELDEDDCYDRASQPSPIESCLDVSRQSTIAWEALNRSKTQAPPSKATPSISPADSSEDDATSLEATDEMCSSSHRFPTSGLQQTSRQISCPTTPKPAKTFPRSRQISRNDSRWRTW